ncbi:hypothetical protein ALP07_200020 [Pseudomonas savastanoi pv. glycinea]|nr:hypothetical protein ALP07_200020 [Pseudomonas savastanoi pv. glycinea]
MLERSTLRTDKHVVTRKRLYCQTLINCKSTKTLRSLSFFRKTATHKMPMISLNIVQPTVEYILFINNRCLITAH